MISSIMSIVLFFFFFFSSRRRHTRCSRDWSSDVCSSDLEAERQVRPDGMHFEQSTYYHTYALDFFLHSRILAGLNGMAVSAMFERDMEKKRAGLFPFGRGGCPPPFWDDCGGGGLCPHRSHG